MAECCVLVVNITKIGTKSIFCGKVASIFVRTGIYLSRFCYATTPPKGSGCPAPDRIASRSKASLRRVLSLLVFFIFFFALGSLFLSSLTLLF